MTTGIVRWARPLLGSAVTAFFLWLLLRRLDLTGAGAAIIRISVPSLLAALCFLALGYWVRIVRWWWMLRVLDPHVRLRACAGPFLASIAVNNVLPLRAGDVVRVIGFRTELRSPAMRLLGTLVVERLLDLMTLLAFFFVGLLRAADGGLPDTFVRLAMWIAAAGMATVLGILSFTTRIERVMQWIAERSSLAGRGWSEQIRRHGGHFFSALGVLRTPSLTLQLIGLSAAVWTLEGAVFATVSHALDTHVSVAAPWFALATGTLATLLPSSPGYIGTFDYFATLGLVAYGADREMAAAFAVIVHVVLWLPLTVAGMGYFLRPGARMLRRQVAAAVSAQGK